MALDDQLAAACRLGSAAAVRSALAEGADPSFVAPGGRSPVFEAAYHGHLEVLALLCDRDADVGLGWTMAMTGMAYTAREIALLCGHTAVVQLLVRQWILSQPPGHASSHLPGATAAHWLWVAS